MEGLTIYSGMTTKIRAMRSRLLTKAQYRELLEQPSVAAAVNYLKVLPDYEEILKDLADEDLHRGKIEKLLRQSIFDNYSKLFHFAGMKQQEFLRAYFIRYEVDFLKECLTAIFDHRDNTLDLSEYEAFFNKYSKLTLAPLTAAKTPEELVSLLRDTDYYAPLARLTGVSGVTLFDYEMALDILQFHKMWKVKAKITEKFELKYLTKILGSKFDMLNIVWVYRSKKYYHMTNAELYSYLIPVNYHLRKSDIKAMVEAESLNALEGILTNTYYGRRYQNFSIEEMDKTYSMVMKDVLISEARQHPYSISSMYSYLSNKEHEVHQLVIALECIRYQVPIEMAEEHLNCREKP